MVGAIRIGLADDHPLLLRGVEEVLQESGRYEVVARGRSADDAVAIVDKANIAALIIDLSMPGDVLGAIATIRRKYPKVSQIVFTAYANSVLAMRAFEAGASAFVLKGGPAEELYDALDAVFAGRLFVSPGFSGRFPSEARAKGTSSPPKVRFTPREHDLLHGLLAGRTNREIAGSLGLTEKTVKHYMTRLMVKLGVKSRLEAALSARTLLLAGDDALRALGGGDDALRELGKSPDQV
jgi:DNA-binding NarL/FixJ family response regulator